MESQTLWKYPIYDGLDFIEDKYSVNMSCNNDFLSNWIHINLFYISIVWKYNNGEHLVSKMAAVWLQIML